MAEIRVHHRWPDGHESSVYVPSAVVRKSLTEGSAYPLPDFVERLAAALETASLRVLGHAGHRCSIADADALLLRREAAEHDAAGVVVVTRLETL